MQINQLVIGNGEVGSALHSVIDGSWIRDLDNVIETHDDGHQPPKVWDVLHIAIPWTPQFCDTVLDYQVAYSPVVVVVHSTVPVGTCDSMGWVHSPVRGQHPKLDLALRTFPKHFGGEHAALAATVWEHTVLPADQNQTVLHDNAATTEAGKLWELVQLGLQAIVQQQMWIWCEQHGADPDQAYRQFAETYNLGYTELDQFQFIRPVLEHMPGPIGGHCVAPGARMVDHPLARMVADWQGPQTDSW